MKTVFQSCLTVLTLTVGCQVHRPADRIATSPGLEEFGSDALRIRLSYPSRWSRASSDEYVLKLVSPAPGDASISLDVPKLPPHVPGFIPLGLVVNGYIDDLKKQHAGVVVSDPASMKVAGANARRVTSTWIDAGGQSRAEHAVLTVHGDRVYIFRANDPDEDALQASDKILSSVKWE